MVELYEMIQTSNQSLNKVKTLGNSINITSLSNRLEKIGELMCSSSFWSNSKEAEGIINEKNSIETKINIYNKLLNDFEVLIKSLEELKNNYDEEMHNMYSEEYTNLLGKLEDFEILCLLNEEYDSNNAILEIHPGAGGTESQDWANMLFRMYIRYAERNNFKIEILDQEEALDAGIKSVSFIIKGINAYGMLKGEQGVHRLVRISPFDSNSRRHTSFASVDVIPEFTNNIDIEIDEKDLKIDTYRASGAGGQHINKTDSAVRITHLPTGIVVSCQNQRSQIQNKEKCLETLKAKLYQIQLVKKQNEINQIRGEQKLIEWGSQIRSYVFCPYTLVKDNRSEYETSDVNSIMDGNLNDLIFAYLNYLKRD